MKLFVSPKTLFLFIKDKEKYVIKEVKKDKEWYLSEEGEKAYLQADTLGKRVAFFHEYLTNVFTAKSEKEITKMAFFLAEGIAKSKLSYQSYPSIIDEDKNPTLLYFKKTGSFDTCTILLLTNYNEEELDAFSNPEKTPYKRLSYCNNGNVSDQYRLERLIIAIGEGENDQKLVAPFVHNFRNGR
ncbi:MAG: hypothetical protein IJ400_05770 [Clostridia bacterium]|nr:hypothetical protein [Clostridia bacterium]